MIDLLPQPRVRFLCPCVEDELAIEGFVLAGMFPFAATACPTCGRRFLSRIPADFDSSGVFHFEPATGNIKTDVPEWYRGQLVEAIRTRDREPPPLERIRRKPLGPNVAVMNALDPVYGHCLHKLFTYSAVKDDPKLSTLLIVPLFLKWLVPETVDEVWVVHDERNRMAQWNGAVAEAFAEVAAQATQLRYMGPGWGHTVTIEDYTGVKPDRAGLAPARITINWREDRCWTLRGRTLPKAEAVAEQLRLYVGLLELLRNQIPDLEAFVSGYGLFGDFPDWVRDLRITKHDPKLEKLWATAASMSHVAVGVHGSNMILPTAMAASAVEIVPRNKWPTVQVTWEFANRLRAIDAISRYRLLPDSSSCTDIAAVVLAQIRKRQSGALGYAVSQTKSPREAMELRVLHDDVARPIEFPIWRDDTGEEI